MQLKNSKQKIITSLVTLVAIALLVIAAQIVPTNKTPLASPSVIQPTSTPATTTSNTYKDGSYSATGNYSSPGGAESVKVDVTLANNTVSDATVTGNADSGVAQIYQSYFVKGYKTYVVGKPIDSIKLSRVSGSSLTSKGFNDALKKIKQQAAKQS